MQPFVTGSARQCFLGIGKPQLRVLKSRAQVQAQGAGKKPSWELEKPERLWEAGGELWWGSFSPRDNFFFFLL